MITPNNKPLGNEEKDSDEGWAEEELNPSKKKVETKPSFDSYSMYIGSVKDDGFDLNWMGARE